MAETMNDAPLILIADDDIDVLDVLDDVLTGAGYRVCRAHNGTGALGLLDAPLAAAIIDLRMPPPDGWRLLTRLARASQPVPAIVLSGATLSTEAIAQLQAMGVVAVLPKPLPTLATLLDAVRRAAGPPASMPPRLRPVPRAAR